MWKYSLIIALILLSGCAYFGDDYVIGSGSYEIEYYEDGKTIKRMKKECKSPISNVFNVSGIKAN